jgi:hypothetical protein
MDKRTLDELYALYCLAQLTDEQDRRESEIMQLLWDVEEGQAVDERLWKASEDRRRGHARQIRHV